jgi:hypothetical protein
MSADKIAEIRRIYFAATPKTIHRDIDRAIDILKSLKDDQERGKAAVYMEGLSELRKEWKSKR